MKRRTYILTSLVLTLLVGATAIWNYSANTASAQKADVEENAGATVGANEYNAREEFSLTQGGTSGVWRYGYTANDASNAFVPYALATTNNCGGSPAEGWIFSNSGDTTPVIYRFQSPAGCNGTPPDSLFVHPGANGERVVLRWVAPAAGTYQLTGALQRANPSATTDLRILKNETTSLFTGNVNSLYQQPFNLTVTVAANDTIDLSVGFGNGTYNSDGSSLNVTVSQPITACTLAPANLQVNVPAENSPIDVESVNTNAQLVGDATYTNMGKVGRAFDFDGSGDYVRIDDNAAQRPANAVTVEGWFKFDSIGGLVSLVSKPLRNSAFNSYSLYLDGGQLRGFAAHPSQYTRVFSNFTPQTGVWHHLAFTYDFSGGVSTLKLYANGVEVTSGQDGTPNLPLFYDANPHPLLIGGEYENNAPGFFQDGQADEVSVYGRALAQAEIFDIVQQGSFGKCAPGSACTPVPGGLISWYRGEQNAFDSQSNNHGTNGGATFASGKVGRSFNFNGSSKVSVPNAAALNPQNITVEAWIQPNSPVGLQTIVGKFEHFSSNLSYNLALSGSQLRWQFNTVGGSPLYTADASALFDGQFHHVAATYDGATSNIYIDGALVRTDNFAGGALTASPIPLYLGAARNSGNDDFFFTGRIDEVSIYGRSLGALEIQSIYTAQAGGKCSIGVCAPPPNDLVSWFAGEQNALDAKSNNHGTLQNGATFQTGKVGQGIKFDGVDDRVEIPDSASLKPQNLTIETWVKFDSLSSNTSGGALNGTQYLVFKKNQSAGNFEAYSLAKLDNNRFRLGFAPGNGSPGAVADSTTSATTGVFYHVVGTYDGSSIKIYVNGQLEATVPYSVPLNYDTRPIFFGTSGEPFDGKFNGVLDETSIYSRALTAAEISSLYNAASTGKCKPTGLNPTTNLVGFWTGDGDARDFAGEDQNGTNSGATFAVGKVGQSFNFTNNPQNVSIPDSAAMRPANFTIEAWTKSLNNGGTRHIFAKTLGAGVSDSYVFWVNNGSLNGAICQADNNCFQISTAAPNPGEWHHLALSFDDATDSLRLYIDGVQAASGATALSVGYDTHAALIGADYANEVITDSWRGQIDEVSFYNRALTQPEISAVYNAGAAGKVKAKTINVLPPLRKNSKGSELLPPATVQLSDATVSFANVTSSGAVSENGIDLGFLPALPPGVRFTGLAYDIRTTAGYQQGSPDDVQVCFNVPSLAALNFANLRILHLENGTWVNRSSAVNTSPVLCTDNLTALSEGFAIVETLVPTAASVSVSGRVADASGSALGGVSVSLTDSQGRSVSTRTNNFGRYSFTNVAAGEIYIVSVASKRYTFGVSSQAISVQDAVENIDFTANSGAFRFDETKP